MRSVTEVNNKNVIVANIKQTSLCPKPQTNKVILTSHKR